MATAVAALISAIAAIGALTFTARQSEATQAQIAQAEQSQVTSRYTAAVAQLGDAALEVRLGGIYALERLARDSPRDQPTVTEVLSAYLRSKLPVAGSAACTARPETASADPVVQAQALPADLSSALIVLGRRDHEHDAGVTPDLRQTCLRALTLPDHLDLSYADLTQADLTATTASSLNLTGASLSGADLTGAQLFASDLSDAQLTGANLSRAFLLAKPLTQAVLSDATLSQAQFAGVDFTGAWLAAADVTDAAFQTIQWAKNGAPVTLAPGILRLEGSRGRPARVDHG